MAVPGWYPIDGGAERWWDGAEWTEYVRQPINHSPPQPQQRWWLIGLLGFGVLVVLVAVVIAIAPSEADRDEEVMPSTTAVQTTTAAQTTTEAQTATTAHAPTGQTTALVSSSVESSTRLSVATSMWSLATGLLILLQSV